MTFSEKLYTLRKDRKMSQEDVAEILGVSRQAVQKWEAGTSLPDTKNLIALSEYFNLSLDALLKDDLHLEVTNPTESSAPIRSGSPIYYEYKSERTWLGLPLVHIRFGYGLPLAKGIIAIGNTAMGLIAIGGLSLGLLTIGGFCLGLLVLCGIGLGGVTIGGIATGIVTFGGISIGWLAMGGVAIGQYAIGSVALASRIALGEVSWAHLAIGEKAKGAFVITGNLKIVSPAEVRKTILQIFPRIWPPLIRLFTFFFY